MVLAFYGRNGACIHGELSFSMSCDTGPVPGDLDREWN